MATRRPEKFDPTRLSDEEMAQRRAAYAQMFERAATSPKSPARPDRADKRMVAGYLEPDAFRELKVMLAKNDMTTDAAVSKAVALLFESHGEKVPHSLAKRLKTLGL